MRAIPGNNRVSTWRKLAGIVGVSVLAMSAVGGTVSAANSRILYVGTNLVDATGTIIDLVNNVTGLTPPDGIPDNAEKLTPTPVNAGFSTAVPIDVLNVDNQTIAHVNLAFPAPAPVGSPLPSGLTVSSIEGVDAGACSIVRNLAGAGIGVTCNFDNLAGGAVRRFYVVVDAATATTALDLFTAQVTTNNENGSNLQVFNATSGTFRVQAANANGLSTFVKPGQGNKTYNTNAVAGSNKLQTKLNFNQSAGGNLVSIAETDGGSTAFLYTCPTGLTCQPFEATISVQDGLSGAATDFGQSPFLVVTLTALVPKTYTLSKAFVAHYGASVTVPDWTLFWNDKLTRCGTDVAATLATLDQCFNSATLSKPNADGFQTVVLTVTMEHNGGTRM
jgi:hypothetical protein